MTDDKGLASDVIESIMTPGYTAKRVVQVMFYSFYVLFITLAVLVVLSGFNGHVITLLLLSICLFAMIRWFIAEYEKTTREQEAGGKSIPEPKETRIQEKKTVKQS